MGLEEANTNMERLSLNVGTATAKFGILTAILQDVNRALPIDNLRRMAVGFDSLNRNLSTTSRETQKLRDHVRELSQTTNYYTREVLTQMAVKLRDSTGSITAFTRESDKLLNVFAETYKKDGPKYLDLFLRISEQMPILGLRVKAASTSMTTLTEIFQRAGPEGVSAYLAAIGQMEKETKNKLGNIDDVFTQFKNSIVNTTVDLGESITKNIGSALKGVGKLFGTELTPDMFGTAALGVGLAGGAFGAAKKLGVGGKEGMFGRGGFAGAAQQAFTFGPTTGPITSQMARQGGRQRITAGLLGGRGFASRAAGIGLGVTALAASGQRETTFEKAIGYGGAALTGAQIGFGLGGGPLGAAAGAVVGVTILALSDKAQSDFRKSIRLGGEETPEEKSAKELAKERFEAGATLAQRRGGSGERRGVALTFGEQLRRGSLRTTTVEGGPEQQARFKKEAIREEITRTFGIEQSFKGVEQQVLGTKQIENLTTALEADTSIVEGSIEERKEANNILVKKMETLSAGITNLSDPKFRAQFTNLAETPQEAQAFESRLNKLRNVARASILTTRQTLIAGRDEEAAAAGVPVQRGLQRLGTMEARDVRGGEEFNKLTRETLGHLEEQEAAIDRQVKIYKEQEKTGKLNIADQKAMTDKLKDQQEIGLQISNFKLRGLTTAEKDLGLTTANLQANEQWRAVAGDNVEFLDKGTRALADQDQKLANNLAKQRDVAKAAGLINEARELEARGIGAHTSKVQRLQQIENRRIDGLSIESQKRKEILALTTEGIGPMNQLKSINEDITILQERLSKQASKGGLSPEARRQAQAQLETAEKRAELQKDVVIPLAKQGLVLNKEQQRLQILGGAGPEEQTKLLQMQVDMVQFRLDKEKNLGSIQTKKLENEKELLQLQIRQNEEATKPMRIAGRRVETAQKELQLLEAARVPVGLIADARLKILDAQQGTLQAAKQNLAFVLKTTDSVDAIHAARMQVKDAEIAIAQNLDFQRRTFAEMFTEQMLNMPAGSFLQPGMVSGFGLQGTTFRPGVSQRRPFGGGERGTYQSQIAGVFGPGVNERTPAEQMFERLFNKTLNVRVTNPDEMPNPIGDGAAGG